MRGNRRKAVAVSLAAAVLGLSLAVISPAAVKLVNRNSQGQAANDESSTEAAGLVSHDGRFVAFTSRAPNLPAGDGATDRAYVRNMETGRTHLVSVTSSGQPASGPVTPFSISANGRFAAFYGPGDGLPGAGANPQVWVHDRKSGRTRLASRSNSGEPGDGFSSVPFLSGGGRFVAFRSDAANLPGSDGTNDYMYVRDLERGKTILISRTTSGEPVPGNCVCQAISADGRFAVFESDDAGLPGGDGNTVHAYRRDLKRNRTTLIDRTTSGEIAEDDSREPSIAGGGRYVVFRSTAANLPGANGEQQLYRRDLNRGQTRLVSRNNRGQAADEGVADGRVSGDGGVVVFSTEALNLPGDGDLSTFQVYARAAGKTRLISKAANGAPGDDDSFYTSISLNGRFATFDSYADNLGGNPDFSNLFRTGPLR